VSVPRDQSPGSVQWFKGAQNLLDCMPQTAAERSCLIQGPLYFRCMGFCSLSSLKDAETRLRRADRTGHAGSKKTRP
jgi:hypothetical protein